MAVDKNLFLYDLAIVAIMKNEGRYVKEWLDYHLAAGVDHFYIFDNDSTDNFQEILKPYIDAGTVDYIFYPGKAMQQVAYNEAIQKFRFFCRYIAFVDADEFILPKSNKSIPEVVDEILQDKNEAGGLVINWMMYGSNNFEDADYSVGVLERFTRRANNLRDTIKTIANPRCVDYIFTPHYMVYFKDFFQLDKSSLPLFPNSNYKISDKIILNHYYCKSREEYALKNPRGDASYVGKITYPMDKFNHAEDNDVFDDSILRYRATRLQMGGGSGKQIDYRQIYIALMKNLLPVLEKDIPGEIFFGRMDNFLTCRKVAEKLRENFLDAESAKFLEEAALKAIHKTLFTNTSLADIKLLLSEMPNILQLDYPVVPKIVEALIRILQQVKDSIRFSITGPKEMMRWKDFVEYDYLLRMLQTFKFPEKN